MKHSEFQLGRSFFLRSVLLAFCAAPVFAQGTDNCASATAITGLGSFPVSTFGATDSAQQSGSCPTAHADVWFAWTATATQAVEVSLCGSTSADTVLAVYSGSSCPSSALLLNCNDDTCGLESTVDFSAVAGQTYMIQVGDFNAGVTYTGTLLFSVGSVSSCGTNTGPDIIVGDLMDVANYAGQNVGGIDYDALALGTFSCNIGTFWCNWMSGTNQHPVIDNNLYKYKVVNGSGRIEQIGMSWLKHGFFALSSTLCCAGCQATDGTHLGVNCADPYSAGLNGSQSGAGPRWQVNATTGVFTYPPANPTYSGSVARRCQVKVSDLEPSSASVRYFGEAQYVTQDDAAAGNNDNNASYREMSVVGAGNAWDFDLIAPTVRENPAILAWQAVDPSVQIANIDIPGDGRVILGWKVTALGGGQWHYEYALFNLNSDASIQALSVPKGAGVNVTNIGFHDIDYHDGDGIGNVDFDGTDWVATNGGSSVNWATATFAQNQSANALRWGTLYNFRFDANVPPSAGQLALSTFKVVGSVGVQAEVPGLPQAGPFCFGDGSGAACPCNNSGSIGHGCANSVNAAGALLAASGTTSPDTLQLTNSGELASAFSILLQGNQDLVNPAVFGDGLRCVGGSLKRLFQGNAAGGTMAFPPAGGPSISVRSGALGDPLAPGSVRSYQVYYRDPSTSFCAAPLGGTFNVGNAQRVIW
ncbi:MAG: hypothetical protein IPJ19_07530 [Planctomycetes bacterium]|nr:hypothetical protein [Planctomycetota bacterium]